MAATLKNGNPPHTLTTEEQRKGGIASGESRKARKTFKEELVALLSKDNNNEKLSIAILKKALEGDIQAFNTIRDTIGEKPIEKSEQEIVNKIRVDVTDD